MPRKMRRDWEEERPSIGTSRNLSGMTLRLKEKWMLWTWGRSPLGRGTSKHRGISFGCSRDRKASVVHVQSTGGEEIREEIRAHRCTLGSSKEMDERFQIQHSGHRVEMGWGRSWWDRELGGCGRGKRGG